MPDLQVHTEIPKNSPLTAPIYSSALHVWPLPYAVPLIKVKSNK
jgi:hypothetical protein